MSNQQLSTFQFHTTGESLRGLLNLRLSQFDRSIERGQAMHAAAIAELERVEHELKQNVAALAARPAVIPGLTQQFGTPDLTQYKRNIENVRVALDVLQLHRDQLKWLQQQIVPNERYDIAAFDLRVLGFDLNENPSSVDALVGRMY